MDGPVRTQALTNYFEVARFVGLDPYDMLRRFRISPAILADPDATLPSNAVADPSVSTLDEARAVAIAAPSTTTTTTVAATIRSPRLDILALPRNRKESCL